MRKVVLAGTQMKMSWDIEDNISKAKGLVREAAKNGANIILLPELFMSPYFCQKENYDYFKLAEEFESSRLVKEFSYLAKELKVVLPISFFEKAGNCFFNSIAIIDANGEVLGLYRKTHIPDGDCYEEKFYFSPGDTGFKTFKTMYGTIGVGICWDQWFPETARCMALMGAEVLLYPTAIGSEPVLEHDSMPHWQNVMKGHAAANIMPVVASNRIGKEDETNSTMTFYGSSFIALENGEIAKSMNRIDEGVITYEFDLDALAIKRYSWGVFRDRRPEKYEIISHLTNKNY